MRIQTYLSAYRKSVALLETWSFALHTDGAIASEHITKYMRQIKAFESGIIARFGNLCEDCGGSGEFIFQDIVGHVSHDMAMDAQDMAFEGMPIYGEVREQCESCDGEGNFGYDHHNLWKRA